MNNKTIFSILTAVVFVALSIAFVSADPSISLSQSSLTFGAKATSFNIIVTNTGTETLNLSLPSPVTFSSGSSTAVVSFSDSNLNNLGPNNQTTIHIALSGDPQSFPIDTYSSSSQINATNSTDSSLVFSAPLSLSLISSFCSSGRVGNNLTITKLDVTNDGAGDDNSWDLLDTVNVDVEVKNQGKNNIRDVNVKLALIDSNGNDITSDLDFQNSDQEEISLGTMNNGDRETASFQFKVPADVADGNYELIAKTYSDDIGEDFECTDKSFSTEVLRKDKGADYLTADTIDISPTDLTCGDSATLSFKVVNVGNNDITDRFRVDLDNSELNLSQTQDVKKDLNMGDSQLVSFAFNIPQNAKDKTYTLGITLENGYRLSSDSFKYQSDVIKLPLKVSGCAVQQELPGTTDTASVTASLASEVKAGSPLAVTVTVTNIGSTTAAFVVTPADFDTWANFQSASNSLLNLAPGETGQVTLTLNVNPDASGSQTFTVNTVSAGKTLSKTVSVDVPVSPTKTSNINSLFTGNYLIWVIAAINIVLILLIILVAVRLSRK